MDCRIVPDPGLGVQILQVFFSDNRSALADESIDQVSVALIVGKELFVTDVRTWNCAQVHTSFAQESEHAKWTTLSAIFQ